MNTYTFLVRVATAREPEEAEAALRDVLPIWFPWAPLPTVEEVFITKQGRVLREADIEKLAAEAERGYDVEKVEFRRFQDR